MRVHGRTAMVQQQPWILGRTVRDNVVLGRGSQPLDVSRAYRVHRLLLVDFSRRPVPPL
jgi:hypothetical protein